jgi:hypothetical protein
MRPGFGKKWVITAAVIVLGIRLWMQVRGKTKTPFAEFIVGYCALFFFLAIVSEWAEPAAASLAGIVVVGDVLTNGASLFEDVSSVVTGTEKGGQILTPTPFGPPGTPNTSGATG